jgi:hypothetical protein
MGLLLLLWRTDLAAVHLVFLSDSCFPVVFLLVLVLLLLLLQPCLCHTPLYKEETMPQCQTSPRTLARMHLLAAAFAAAAAAAAATAAAAAACSVCVMRLVSLTDAVLYTNPAKAHT